MAAARLSHGLLFCARYRRERRWTCSRIVYPDGKLIPTISPPLVLCREAITPRDVMDAMPGLDCFRCNALRLTLPVVVWTARPQQ